MSIAKQISLVMVLLLAGYATAAGKKNSGGRQGPLRGHVYKGYFSDFWFIDFAMARIHGMQSSASSYSTVRHGFAGHPGQPAQRPRSVGELMSLDLLVLAGSDLGGIPGNVSKAIPKWIEGGGSLVILGGPRSFAQSRQVRALLGGPHSRVAAVARSATLQGLPVALESKFDLIRDSCPIRPGPDAAACPDLAKVDWRQPMLTLFRHRARLRDGVKVLLGTAQKPLAVTVGRGKGQITCFLFAPMGDETTVRKGKSAFWMDPRFPQVLAAVLRGTLRRAGPKAPNTWRPKGRKAPKELAEMLDDMSMTGLDLDKDDDEILTDGNAPENPVHNVPLLKPPQLARVQANIGPWAVPYILRAMDAAGKADLAFNLADAARPYIRAKHAPLLKALCGHPLPFVRLAAVSLVGGISEKEAQPILINILRGKAHEGIWAAAMAVGDGRFASLKKNLRAKHRVLRQQMAGQRLNIFAKINLQHPGNVEWAYAELVLARLRLGEADSDLIQEAIEVMFMAHVEDINMRSFLFNYNLSVSAERNAYKQHIVDLAVCRPRLDQLIRRYRTMLAALPAPAHPQFREAGLQCRDLEKLLPLLPVVEDLTHAHPADPDWRQFLPKFREHVFRVAVTSKRF